MSKGFVREGEHLFLSARTQLSIVLEGGSYTLIGSKMIATKPLFVDFLPGPFGGQYRTKDKNIAERIRAHKSFSDKSVVEIASDEELAAYARSTEEKRNRKDNVPTVLRKALSIPEAQTPESPDFVAPQVPRAAKGPGRPRRQAVAA